VRLHRDDSSSADGIAGSGEEGEQPADLVILSAYSLFNAQLMLHSGIGQPYDPISGNGTVGRNFTHQTVSSVNGFFDSKKYNFNPFIGSGSIGMCIDEFNGDNFDYGPLGFVGGGYVDQVQTGARPIESTLTPPGTPKWGVAWKQSVKDNYLSTVKPGTGVHGSFYAYRDIYLDLDPVYRDRLGRPLIRLTIDLKENEVKQQASDRQVRRNHKGDGGGPLSYLE
jgi:gluconate 2-dehydrogenase alpha chain